MSIQRICHSLSDFIAVAERPVIVSGEIYKKRSGRVYMDIDVRDGMLELMALAYCRNVKFGTYECYEDTKYGFPVDGCLVGEINRLNNSGVKTIGCCCGHGKKPAYIQVAPEYGKQMEVAEYIKFELDEHGNGEWCFIPKTPLPKASQCNVEDAE